MDFRDKLKFLTAGKNKAQIAKQAGISPTSIADYLNKGFVPRADNALALARALNVSLIWLCDKNRDDTPPPFGNDQSPPLHEVGDTDLIREVARRYRRAQLDFMDEAARVKKLNWVELSGLLARLNPGDALPDEAKRAMHALSSVQVKFNRIHADLDVDAYCHIHHRELPGGERPFGDFELVSRGEIWATIELTPGVKRFAELMQLKPEWLDSPLKKASDLYNLKSLEYARAVARFDDEENKRIHQKLAESHSSSEKI